jgi:hypothetical protein
MILQFRLGNGPDGSDTPKFNQACRRAFHSGPSSPDMQGLDGL